MSDLSEVSAPQGLLSDYLTDDELAAELGVTTRTLRNWRAMGETPRVTRIGRSRRNLTARADVEEWLRASRIEPRWAGE